MLHEYVAPVSAAVIDEVLAKVLISVHFDQIREIIDVCEVEKRSNKRSVHSGLNKSQNFRNLVRSRRIYHHPGPAVVVSFKIIVSI